MRGYTYNQLGRVINNKESIQEQIQNILQAVPGSQEAEAVMSVVRWQLTQLTELKKRVPKQEEKGPFSVELKRAFLILSFRLLHVYMLQSVWKKIFPNNSEFSTLLSQLEIQKETLLNSQTIWDKDRVSEGKMILFNAYAGFDAIVSKKIQELPPESFLSRWLRKAKEFFQCLIGEKPSLLSPEKLESLKSKPVRIAKKCTNGKDLFNAKKLQSHEIKVSIDHVFFSTIYHKWHEIAMPHKDVTKGNILLSGLPRAKDVKAILAECPNLTLVVEVIEPFEKQPRLNFQPSDWDAVNVHCHLVNMPDHSADVQLEDIDNAVEKIKETIDAGKDVLTHCRQGRGRSHLVLLCYLAKHEFAHWKNPEAIMLRARGLVKSQRALATLSSQKKAILENYIHRYVLTNPAPSIRGR